MSSEVEEFMSTVRDRSPGQEQFHRAVHEAVTSIMPRIEGNSAYRGAKILERMAEPERVLTFRVSWVDDHGDVHVNRGYRVEMNGAIGPYKGGLRFAPDVDLDTFKFLAFEQVLKNSLTTLPMGGAKGGADFDPKGRSDGEIMRFCQAFMNELYRHIGPETDVPAGDIGVGPRELGFLFGQYRKLTNRFCGALTGKGPSWSGSLLRAEATGYGTVYFAHQMLDHDDQGLDGKVVAISGSGNVAQYAVEKLIERGAKVVTMSDSDGTIVDSDGIDESKLRWIMELKNDRRGRIREYVDEYSDARYLEGKRPWGVECDVAMPCATQNELEKDDARALLDHGCTCVVEGANMPSTPEAVSLFAEAGILYGPGKAANAGGVAVSGMEITQNAMHLGWTREEVDQRLHGIMLAIHDACVEHGSSRSKGPVNYVDGANLGGFLRVANAMLDHGIT